MGHVTEGINKLFLAQRAAHPVGKLAGFVNLAANHALDEIVIRDRIAKAECHGSDLCVKDRAGRVADQPIEYFDVLSGRVKHLDPVVRRDQVEEGPNVQILG